MKLSKNQCDANDWAWCSEHDQPYYHGRHPCFRLHEVMPDDVRAANARSDVPALVAEVRLARAAAVGIPVEPGAQK